MICPLCQLSHYNGGIHFFFSGSFYRIRSAFKYGARKLGWILMLPEDRIADELNRFFANTLDRHGNTQGNEDKLFLCLSTGSKLDRIPGSYKLEDSKLVGTSGVLGIASTNGLSCLSNGKVESRICSDTAVTSVIDDEKERNGMVSYSLRCHNDEKNLASNGAAVPRDAAHALETNFFHSDRCTTSSSGGTDASKSLLDLAGDYDSHIGNLQYGHMCNGYAISPLVVPSPPRSPKFHNRNPWETVRQSLQINQGIHAQANSNCVVGQQLYLVNHPTLPVTSFGSEENRKLRGTGAYFPNLVSTAIKIGYPDTSKLFWYMIFSVIQSSSNC